MRSRLDNKSVILTNKSGHGIIPIGRFSIGESMKQEQYSEACDNVSHAIDIPITSYAKATTTVILSGDKSFKCSLSFWQGLNDDEIATSPIVDFYIKTIGDFIYNDKIWFVGYWPFETSVLMVFTYEIGLDN